MTERQVAPNLAVAGQLSVTSVGYSWADPDDHDHIAGAQDDEADVPAREHAYRSAMVTIDSGHVTANGVDVVYLQCGDGPLALCLHGFPDSAHTWRDLLPALADSGFRAVAPFLRGYAPTSIPADGRYQIGVLAQDAIALHEALGGDSHAVIIGHDYGAAAAYGAVNGASDRWRRLVTLALPPGDALLQALLTNIEQLKRSWYMFFFQHPLAEAVVAADDLAFIDRLWADWSPGFDPAEDLALLKPSLRDPENLAAALAYYRAALGGIGVDPALEGLQEASQQMPVLPTLYLHGTNDGCIGPEVAAHAAAAAPDHVRIEHLDGCGHFMHREQPAAVRRLVLEHLTA